MKHFGIYIAAFVTSSLLLLGCSGGSSLQIKGKLKNFKQGQFFVYSESPEWDDLDTIQVDEGEFSFSKNISDTTIVTIKFSDKVQRMIVAIPGKTVKISGDASSLAEMEITGDDDNELLSEFNKKTYKLPESDRTAKAEKFIQEHPGSYAAFVIFQKEFLQVESMNLEKIDTYLKLMLKHAPDRLQLQTLNAQLSSLVNCRPGKPLPAFKATTLKKEKISNSTFKDKWILINFWASWNREYSQLLSRSHSALKHLGSNVKALNICLDADTVGCNIEIRQDTITGYNICDCQSWESPLVKKFGLRYLPSNILVDNHGKIVARDIKEDNLESELKKYIKN